MSLNLVAELLQASHGSVRDLRARISGVRLLPLGAKDEFEFLTFSLDGVPYRGKLAGRNRMLVVGGSPAQDAGIALRVLLDGHAIPMDTQPSPAVVSP